MKTANCVYMSASTDEIAFVRYRVRVMSVNLILSLGNTALVDRMFELLHGFCTDHFRL
jgi:hypothetical protein